MQLLRLAICVRRRHAIRHHVIRRHCYHATRLRALLWYGKRHATRHRAPLWYGKHRGMRCPVPLWHERQCCGTRYCGSCARSSRCVHHGRQIRVHRRFHGHDRQTRVHRRFRGHRRRHGTILRPRRRSDDRPSRCYSPSSPRAPRPGRCRYRNSPAHKSPWVRSRRVRSHSSHRNTWAD